MAPSFFLFVVLIQFGLGSRLIASQHRSWNDLEFWISGIKKGMHEVLIDVYWVSQSDAAGNVSGEFLLTHAPPTINYIYSTLFEVLDFLKNNLEIFKNPTRTYRITLAFKAAPPNICAGTVAAKKWISLIDEFVGLANSMLTTYQLNVEFVLSGEATPEGERECLATMWEPWKATWSGLPHAAYTSNDASLGYHRFQVYSANDFTNFSTHLKSNFGKFGVNQYPIHASGVSDEVNLYKFTEPFAAWANSTGNSKPLIFATTSDPLMFQLYTANVSRESDTYLHRPLRSHGATPKVVFVAEFSVVLFFYIDSEIIRYTMYSLGHVCHFCFIKDEELPLPWRIDARDYEVPTKAPTAVQGVGTTILVSDGHGQNFLFKVGPKGLQYASTLNTRPPVHRSVMWVFPDSFGNFGVELWVDAKDPNCSLAIQIWKLLPFVRKGDPACLIPGTVNLFDYSLEMVPGRRSGCVSEGIVAYSDNSTIYAFPFCLMGNESRATGTPRAIGVGEKPQLSVSLVGNDWGLYVSIQPFFECFLNSF